MSDSSSLRQQFDRLGLFDGDWYLETNEDVRASGLDPWRHYVDFGLAERRLPGPLCDPVSGKGLRVLYALSLSSGGTPQTNEDLMGALSAKADCFVLRCLGREMELVLFCCGRYALIARYTLAAPVAPLPHTNEEFDRVAGTWLECLGISLLHVRHSVYQSLGLMDAAYSRNIPVVYSFHDYYAICPSVKLLDENRQFCRGRCTASPGECQPELWPEDQIQPLKHDSVYSWQTQFAGALALCSGYVSTAKSVKRNMIEVFPALEGKPFRVIPHGRDFSELAVLGECPEPGKRLRVLVPGHIGVSKGLDVLKDLAAMPALDQVEWHVLGTLQQPPEASVPANVVVHGSYQRENFLRHVKEIKPHIAAVLSIWPETWCHTLTELWSAGLPVLGFNSGAVGERLTKTGAGWVVPLMDAESAAQTLSQACQPDDWSTALKRVVEWQNNGQRSCREMADEYWQLYEEFLEV